jgi:hypothetical protein
MKILRWIDKNEKFLFYSCIVFNLSFIYQFGNLPTLDGPAHLNNSRLIYSMIFEHNEVLKNYFLFNPTLEPNWTGHLIISFLMLFFKANVCEKIVLTFYVVMLPISFRSLINTISSGKVLLSYFIFPLSFSLLFFLGFYNFSIGLVVLFISLNFLIKNFTQIHKIQNLCIFTLLQLIAYFSHIVIFAALWLSILFWIINYYSSGKFTFKMWFLKEVQRLFFLLLTGLIPFVLFIIYFINHATFNKNAIYKDMNTLVKWLYQVRVKIVFMVEKEEVYSTWIFVLLFSLFILALNNRIVNFKNEISNSKKQSTLIHLLKAYDFWLLVALILLFLYFVLPDATSTGSVISVRFSLLFYLFLIIWISNIDFSKVILYMMVLTLIYINWSTNKYYAEILRPVNTNINECKKLANYLKPNSTVIVLDYSNDWFQRHFSNNLAIDKPLLC